MKQVQEILERAREERFWGSVQLDFQNGEITIIKKSETIKVQRENNSANYGNPRATR
jgi:hypothetical protein